jgi:hypothetical protein
LGRSACAGATFPDIERKLVPELDGLEIALGIVQPLSAIACATSAVGNVVAYRVAVLAYACGASAMRASAGTHSGTNNILAADPLVSFHRHVIYSTFAVTLLRFSLSVVASFHSRQSLH